MAQSRPVWGAWIEMIPAPASIFQEVKSRPGWGAWIEIKAVGKWFSNLWGRAPYGARGLKFGISLVVVGRVSSRPVWGAWIEIGLCG